jgi:hypothetical protein
MQHVLHYGVYHFAHCDGSDPLDTSSYKLESPSIMKKPCHGPLIVRLLSGAELVFLHVAEIL